MDGKRGFWLILLLLSGCTMAEQEPPQYVARPLQPNNCGTPYEFKPCRRSAPVAVGQVRPRPTVTIEVPASTYQSGRSRHIFACAKAASDQPEPVLTKARPWLERISICRVIVRHELPEVVPAKSDAG